LSSCGARDRAPGAGDEEGEGSGAMRAGSVGVWLVACSSMVSMRMGWPFRCVEVPRSCVPLYTQGRARFVRTEPVGTRVLALA